MSSTYRAYTNKKKIKYEVGIHYFICDKLGTYSGDMAIGTYDKKDANKIYKAVDKVLELTKIKSPTGRL